MNAQAIPGVQKWTPTEITKKEEAVASGARRSLVNLVQSAAEGEFEIVRTDGDTQEADWTYYLSAQNHLLSQLNFPNKLKPFLDTIISSACGNGELEFTATNLEIGQKSRSGRDACSDKSMEKWVSRYKRELAEWMAYKSFQLVSWQDGEYDFELNKRYPTRYKVHFNKYVVKTVNLAKTKFYWTSGEAGRAKRNRALREAARRTLQEIPEAPNLRLKPPKTLSEEQKFDRRHHSMLTFMEKNRDALKKLNLDPVVYFRYLITEIDKIATNPSGMVGKMLTPEKDEADHKASVWNKIRTGEIMDDIENNSQALDHKFDLLERVDFEVVHYAYEATKGEEKEIQTPKYFRDGAFVDSDQRFEEAPKSAQSVKQSDENFDQPDILSTKGTFLSVTEENADKIDVLTKTSDLKHQGDIFVPLVAETGESVKQSGDLPDKLVPPSEDFSESGNDDFSNWFNDAAGVDQTPVVTTDYLQALFESWIFKIRELLPDKSPPELWAGAWQFFIDLEFATERQNELRRAMETVRADVLEGSAELSDFRRSFVDWIAACSTYYEKGAAVSQSAEKMKRFKARLEPHLSFEDG